MANDTDINITNTTMYENDVDIQLKMSGYQPDIPSIAEALVLSLIAFVAFTGNVSLWIIVLNKKFKLRKSSNALILGLSGKDLLI